MYGGPSGNPDSAAVTQLEIDALHEDIGSRGLRFSSTTASIRSTLSTDSRLIGVSAKLLGVGKGGWQNPRRQGKVSAAQR